MKTPNPIDVHVGSRVRLRRMMLGMSQETFGEALGVTFQQVQKYEKGANRISASRLFHSARVLTVPVAWFFAELPDGPAGHPDDVAVVDAVALKIAREAAGLAPRHRAAVLDLVRALARIQSDLDLDAAA